MSLLRPAIRGQLLFVRLGEQEIVERTEHILKSFAPLLEPNPRAMKRFANAFNIYRAISTLAHIDIDREQLALWTILSLRWPVLAEYLEGDPDEVAMIGKEDLADIPEHLRELFHDPDVQNVIGGKGVGATLDQETLRSKCVQLRA